MKNRFAVALDFDGVFTNPHQMKRAYLEDKGFRGIPVEMTSKEGAAQWGVPKTIYEAMINELYTQGMEQMPEEPGMVTAFNRLKKEGCPLYVVTSRTDEQAKYMRKWLADRNLQLDGIVNTSEMPKSEAIKLIDASVFIDDSVSKLVEVAENCPGTDCVLYQTPVNTKEEYPAGLDAYIAAWVAMPEMMHHYAIKFIKGHVETLTGALATGTEQLREQRKSYERKGGK